jgi:hypothetical protein
LISLMDWSWLKNESVPLVWESEVLLGRVLFDSKCIKLGLEELVLMWSLSNKELSHFLSFRLLFRPSPRLFFLKSFVSLSISFKTKKNILKVDLPGLEPNRNCCQ